MRDTAVWLSTLLAFPLAGMPLLSHRRFRSWGAAARFVVAAAVGVFAITTTMALFTLAGWKWRLPLLVAAALGECLLLRLALPSATPAPPPPPAPQRAGFRERLALAAILASLLAAAASTYASSSTSTDLLLFWGPKASAFAAARGMDAEYLADLLHRYQHASYPPLVPNAWAFSTLAAGSLPWAGPIATFPILLALLAAALPGLLRRFASAGNALVATAAITASLGLLGRVYQVAGNADMALLLFQLLAVAILVGSAADDRAAQVVAGLLLGGAAAAKVEGLPFAAAAAVFSLALAQPASFVSGWKRAAATAVRLLAPTALALGAWFLFGRQRAVFLGYESYGPALDVHWGMLGLVLGSVARALGRAGWGLPWLVPIAALVASRISRPDGPGRAAWYPVAIGAVLSAFFLFTYLHGPDPSLWIDWSAGRIFAVVSPLLVLAVIAPRAPAVGDTAGERARGEERRG